MPAAPPTDRVPDDELLRRAAAGDAQAFADLFRRRHRDVFRFALHMTGSTAVAEDVVQDVFMIVMRDGARHDAGRATVAAWLYGIARNCVRQRRDRDRRLESIDRAGERDERPDDKGPTDPLTGLLRAERIERLRRAVQALPLPYREAVVLCDLQEMSYEEAAAAAGCPVGTVRSRLHRARAMLGARLDAFGLARGASPAGHDPAARPVDGDWRGPVGAASSGGG